MSNFQGLFVSKLSTQIQVGWK